MARKRKNLKDLRLINPDTSVYWEEVLMREGLHIDAGRSNRLTYAGSSNDLTLISDMSQNETRKVK